MSLFFKPIDPDVKDENMYLNLDWYKNIKLSGYTFMVRAKNEEVNIENCLKSIVQNMHQSIPYQIVLIDNDSQDKTYQIASDIIKNHSEISLTKEAKSRSQSQSQHKIIKYPYRIAKPGIENYSTPLESIHSFVYFTQFCMMQCDHEWIFRWDADFEMTQHLAGFLKTFWDDHMLKKQSNCKTFNFAVIPAIDHDGIINSEMYLFNTSNIPFFIRKQIWEQVEFANPSSHRYCFRATKEQALILHRSTLSVTKLSYFELPWWITKLKHSKQFPVDYVQLMEFIELKCNNLIKQLTPGSQTYCRSMDPNPIELIRILPNDIQYPIYATIITKLF